MHALNMHASVSVSMHLLHMHVYIARVPKRETGNLPELFESRLVFTALSAHGYRVWQKVHSRMGRERMYS